MLPPALRVLRLGPCMQRTGPPGWGCRGWLWRAAASPAACQGPPRASPHHTHPSATMQVEEEERQANEQNLITVVRS